MSEATADAAVSASSGPVSRPAPLLRVRDLELSFGPLKVLRGLSFEVDEVETVALVGPNGAGKTTLLNCVNRIYRQQRGTIHYRNVDLARCRPQAVAKLGIGRTMQFSTIFSNFTVADLVLLGMHTRLHGGIAAYAVGFAQARGLERAARRRCVEVLEMLGITDYAGERIADVPHGVSKLADLARSLIGDPELLLLDEPASGLSQSERRQIADVLVRVRSTRPVAMLVVEHDMTFVNRVASRVVVLHRGGKIGDGDPEKVLATPAVVEAFLGRPK